jgi:hypothetical protein
MRCSGLVKGTEKKQKTDNLWDGKPEGNIPLRLLTRRCVDFSKMDLKKLGTRAWTRHISFSTKASGE